MRLSDERSAPVRRAQATADAETALDIGSAGAGSAGEGPGAYGEFKKCLGVGTPTPSALNGDQWVYIRSFGIPEMPLGNKKEPTGITGGDPQLPQIR